MTYTSKVMKEFREKWLNGDFDGEMAGEYGHQQRIESFLTEALENQRKEILEELKLSNQEAEGIEK